MLAQRTPQGWRNGERSQVVASGMTARLAITLGDPTGIGPEIVAATLARATVAQRARCVVFGDRVPLERAARTLGLGVPADVEVRGVGEGDAAEPGRPDERAGAAQVGYLEAAVAAARAGEFAAIVTAPISKTWARRGGFQFLGHTEMLAERLGAHDVAMFFVGPKLKIALATVHRPLVEVVLELSTERIRRVVELVSASLVADFGVPRPRIGVVGLNPHAGEDGLLGDEDAEESSRRHSRRRASPPCSPGHWCPTLRFAITCTGATTR